MSVINTNPLKSALERLCLVVPKRATLPALENLRWRAAKGHLELTSTDLDNHLRISIPFVGEAIDSDVDALVPAKATLGKLFHRARQEQSRSSLTPHPPRKGVLFTRSSPRLIA